MKLMKRRGASGVTLTELMVVLVVVGLLATIAVPALIGRSTQAKFAVARAECEALAQGEQMCGLTHGFYVPLQLLDNIPNFSGFSPNRDDTISNIPAGMFLIQVDRSASDQISTGQYDMTSNVTSVKTMIDEWQGPFVNFQRPYIPLPASGIFTPTTTSVQYDHPLDPWGNPYRLYSPQGITGSNRGTGGSVTPPTTTDLTVSSFSNADLTNQDDRFDRYAIVSFGPNGIGDFTPISGGTTTPFIGDDVIYFFGGSPADLETTTGGVVIATPTP